MDGVYWIGAEPGPALTGEVGCQPASRSERERLTRRPDPADDRLPEILVHAEEVLRAAPEPAPRAHAVEPLPPREPNRLDH